jgi:hypothetical protein
LTLAILSYSGFSLLATKMPMPVDHIVSLASSR